jgi:ubiquinone/menaquinone biosynthesis C-methylase UbiE
VSNQPSWFQEGLGGGLPELYERYLVPTMFAPWAQQLVALVNPRSGERVLDVACGTGIVARQAAEKVGASGRVVGLDLNAGMLTVARSVPLAAGARIEWREGNALALPFPDGTFDVVLCQQGLQFFPDRAAGLREMRRVLVTGGRLGLNTWRERQYSPGFAVLADALERHVAPGLLDAPYGLSSAEELRSLLADAGFREVTIRAATITLRFPSVELFVKHYGAASPLAGGLAHIDESVRAALVEDVAGALQSSVDDDGLAFLTESHLTIASA